MSDSGGAECDVRGGGDAARSVGVFDDVFGLFGCFSTIERYVSAMLGPEGVVDDGLAGAVVFSSCSDDRTNGTRLRRIPAPKTR